MDINIYLYMSILNKFWSFCMQTFVIKSTDKHFLNEGKIQNIIKGRNFEIM